MLADFPDEILARYPDLTATPAPAALPLVGAASYDCLRLAAQLAVWRPPSGRRGGRIVAVCDQLEQAGGRGLAISAGRGRPGEGAEVVAALQYALTLLATLV